MISIFYIGYHNENFDSTPILRTGTQFLQAETQMLMLLSSSHVAPKILAKLKFWASIQNLSIWKKELFGDANAGAFAGRKDDEDGDIFWDSVEGPYSEPMDKDG